METNYKNMFLKNLRFILKRKHIKMADFEIKIGVSKGYFSRLDSKGSSTSPRIDTMMKATTELGYSIDTLLKDDLSTMDDDKIKVIEKLKKIKDLIESDKIECNYISCNSYTASDEFSYLTTSTFDSETREFNSFYNEYADLEDEGFFYFNYKNKIYHIYKVSYLYPNEFKSTGFEFYVIIDNETRKICNGTYSNGIYMLMYHLYSAAKDNSTRFRIDKDILDILDDF